MNRTQIEQRIAELAQRRDVAMVQAATPMEALASYHQITGMIAALQWTLTLIPVEETDEHPAG